jgi:hypothetical protein
MAYEKQLRRPLQHRPDVPPLPLLPEPLTIDRRVAPKVKAMITTLLRHHDCLAHSDVSVVVLTTRDGQCTLKLTSDLLS